MLRIEQFLAFTLAIVEHWRYLAGALAVFLLTMGFVVTWLTVQIGHGLRHAAGFRVLAVLFVCCGVTQAAHAVCHTDGWPTWLAQSMQAFMLIALGLLSAAMIGSIPPLLEVLRASDEVRSLRGQAKFKALVKAAPMAVVSTDLQGRITSWNPAAEQIFGWKKEEIVGTVAKTIPAERMEEQFKLLDRVLQGEAISGFESMRTRQDGERFPVRMSLAPLYEDYRITGAMGTVEDISSRRQIERELNEKSGTLAAVTTALNAFLENGDYGAASRSILARVMELTNSRMGFIAVVLEESLLRVLAYKATAWDLHTNRQLYNAKLSQLAAQGYFDLSHQDNLFRQIMIQGKTVISNRPSEVSSAKGVPPGHPPIENFLGVPIFKGESIVAVIAVANRPDGYSKQELQSLEAISQTTAILFENYRQSTQRNKLEEQRRFLESEFRQAQKMEVLGQLSGGIAHDFNNMLMVLSGSAELLAKTLPPNFAGNSYLEQIRRTVDKAAAITNQLLAFSRKQVLDAKAIDLHEVLTDSEFMLPRLLGSDVRLTFQHRAAQSWIKADASQLEQVIVNLAVNARDAMPEGGELAISTHNELCLPESVTPGPNVAAVPEWVVLEVSDTGQGMDEETRSHIFEPFYTTKPLGKGTGLGLSTVYGIVRQFEGYILLDSKPGDGSCFQIYFPVQNSLVPAQQIPARAMIETQNIAKLEVLLADDEPPLREAVAEYLRGVGHTVLESHSPYDALEMARSHRGPIDVLLTDVVMPGLRGTELARQVEAMHPEIHVIYMSGYAQSFSEAQIPAGAAFLQKPFRFAALAEQLKLVTRKV